MRRIRIKLFLPLMLLALLLPQTIMADEVQNTSLPSDDGRRRPVENPDAYL